MEQHKNIWIGATVGAVVLVVLLLISGGFGMGGYGMMGFGMGFGFLFMLLFWGGLIWLIITLINASQPTKRSNSDGQEDTPLTILNQRYAKGEITKKEYGSMKKEINEE